MAEREESRDELVARIVSLTQRLEESEAARRNMEKRLCGCESTPLPGEALKLAKIIVEKSPVVLFRRRLFGDMGLQYISENISQWGYAASDFISGSMEYLDILVPEDAERMMEEIRVHGESDAEAYEQEYRIVTRDGRERWVRDQTTVIRDEKGVPRYRQGVVMDVHERKLAEQEVRRSEEKLRRILATAGEGVLYLGTDLIIKYVNDAYCRMLGLPREDILGKTPMDLAAPFYRRFLEANREKLQDMEYRRFEGALMHRDGFEVPVLINANVLRGPEGERMGHVAFVTDLTEQKKALLLAGEVQKSLLPQGAPALAGLDVAGRSVSCDEIGGDYFDYFETSGADSGAFGAAVGDISGHGVDAALLMTTARALFRMRASKSGSLSEIVSDLNSYLVRDLEGSGRFMTLFALMIDPASGGVSWVRAGHDPALVYAPSTDDFTELMGRGLPLGVMPDASYEELAGEGLPKGGVLALGTDGIWEAMNVAGEMYGKERFRRVVRENAKKSAQEILDAVYADLADFTEGARPKDDVTLVVIKRLES